MKKGLFRKGVVLGIIILFFGAGIIPSTVGIKKDKTAYQLIKSGGYIQDLIDNASDGDTINIPSGIYYETIFINKSINLVGEDKNSTIIDGEGDGKTLIYIYADSVKIKGFTIQNTHCHDEGGNRVIISHSNNTVISENIFFNNSGNWMPHDLCIELIGNNNIIENNSFSNNNGIIDVKGTNNFVYRNIASDNCWGFLTIHGNNNSVSNNFISNGAGIRGHGILNNFTANWFIHNEFNICLYDSKFCTISNNSISNTHSNGLGYAPMHFTNCTNNKIYYNEFFNNSYPFLHSSMYFEKSDNNSINFNRFICNDVYTESCISLFFSKNNTLLSNYFSHNIIGISLKHSSNGNTLEFNDISNNSKGIEIDLSSNKNYISNNNIIENDEGISISYSHNNIIEKNIFSSNYEIGLNIDNSSTNSIRGNYFTSNVESIFLKNSTNNIIKRNSFIDNNRQLKYFEKQKQNFWLLNYWNRPRILPKFIFGTLTFNNLKIPWFNIDWRPALKPYNIEVQR